jgi:hypothetical protein
MNRSTSILFISLAFVLWTAAAFSQITSAASGSWNSAATWTGGTIPSAADNVVIAAGHVVTLNTAAAECKDLTVTGTNAKLRFAVDGTVSGLTVYGNAVIGAGALLRVESRSPAGAANSYVEHTLTLYGDLSNNGTVDLRGGSTTGGTSNGVLTTFTGSGISIVTLKSKTYQASLEEFNGVTINKSGSGKVVLSAGNMFTNSSSSVGPAVVTFKRGIVETGSNILVVTATGSASVAGGSDSSFVIGVMGRGMNSSAETEKRFDIGDADGYRPIIIRTTTGGIASGHYVSASIVKGNANTGTSFMSGGIDSVSRYRYYNIGYSKGGIAGTADSMSFKQFSPFYREGDGVTQSMFGLMVAYSPDKRATWVNAGPTNHVADLSNPPTELQSTAISPVITLKDSATMQVALAFGEGSSSGPIPTIPNGSYGPSPLNKFDFWQVPSASPTPLVIHIHGGGLTSGSKVDVSLNYVTALLAKGISVMSINYRLSPEVVVPNHYLDCARAVQYARFHAKELNIDPKKIAASGSSAGGLTSFWLNFHDDLADPVNADSVLRMSSRLSGVACWSGQTTVDKRVALAWVGPMVLEFSSYFKGTIFGIPADSMDTPSALALQQMASPAFHVTKEDPAVWMYYGYVDPPANSSEAIHHVGFGIGLKKILDSLGIGSSILTPSYSGSVTDSAVNFFLQRFNAAPQAVTKEAHSPSSFALEQNYPNPFNPSTTITFSLPMNTSPVERGEGERGNVTIMIYDQLGRHVSTLINSVLSAGTYSVRWDASGLASGIYLCRLQSGGRVATQRMMLLK